MLLRNERCIPCQKGSPALTDDTVAELLRHVPNWALTEDRRSIERVFEFENFHETMGFVNAVAWLANRQDHHPDLEVSYRECKVRFWTHTVDGLSRNDFVCAAQVDGLFD